MSEYGEKIFTRKNILAEQANTSNNMLGHSIKVASVYEQFKCQPPFFSVSYATWTISTFYA